MIRVVVTGGRRYDNACVVEGVVNRLGNKYGPRSLALVCGMATGADLLAYRFAKERGWSAVEEYYADWNKYGRAAGHIRNLQMALTRPAICIEFPGGRGTADMVRKCGQYGIPVYRFS